MAKERPDKLDELKAKGEKEKKEKKADKTSNDKVKKSSKHKDKKEKKEKNSRKDAKLLQAALEIEADGEVLSASPLEQVIEAVEATEPTRASPFSLDGGAEDARSKKVARKAKKEKRSLEAGEAAKSIEAAPVKLNGSEEDSKAKKAARKAKKEKRAREAVEATESGEAPPVHLNNSAEGSEAKKAARKAKKEKKSRGAAVDNLIESSPAPSPIKSSGDVETEKERKKKKRKADQSGENTETPAALTLGETIPARADTGDENPGLFPATLSDHVEAEKGRKKRRIKTDKSGENTERRAAPTLDEAATVHAEEDLEGRGPAMSTGDVESGKERKKKRKKADKSSEHTKAKAVSVFDETTTARVVAEAEQPVSLLSAANGHAEAEKKDGGERTETGKSSENTKIKAVPALDENTTARAETNDKEDVSKADGVNGAEASKTDKTSKTEKDEPLGFVIDVKPKKADLSAPQTKTPAEQQKSKIKDVETKTGDQAEIQQPKRKERRRLQLITHQKEIIQRRLGVPVGSTEANEAVDKQLAAWIVERDKLTDAQEAKKAARKEQRMKLLQTRAGRPLKGKKLKDRKKQLKNLKKEQKRGRVVKKDSGAAASSEH